MLVISGGVGMRSRKQKMHRIIGVQSVLSGRTWKIVLRKSVTISINTWHTKQITWKAFFYHLVILGLLYKRKEHKSLFDICKKMFCPFILITLLPPPHPFSHCSQGLAKSKDENSSVISMGSKSHWSNMYFLMILTIQTVVKRKTIEYQKSCWTQITHSNRKVLRPMLLLTLFFLYNIDVWANLCTLQLFR